MIAFHILWDLDYYGLSPLDQQVYGFAQYVPMMFFSIVGICLVLSSQHKKPWQLITRGFLIFGAGMVITAVTMVFLPDKPVTFGVLHCIGVSIILSTIFIRFKAYNILIAPVFILIGIIINGHYVENPALWQLALGVHPQDLWRYTVDYFPVFPWFGVTLFGMGLGSILYKDGKRQFKFPDLTPYLPVRIMSALGKKSLLIYLVHQPLLIGMIKLPQIISVLSGILSL